MIKSKWLKTLLTSLLVLVVLVLLLNIGIITVQYFSPTNQLKLAIDQRRLTQLAQMKPASFALQLNGEPAIYYVMAVNQQDLLKLFLTKQPDLGVTVQRQGIAMSPAYFARYYGFNNAEAILLTLPGERGSLVRADIAAAQSSLDQVAQGRLIQWLDKDTSRLQNKRE